MDIKKGERGTWILDDTLEPDVDGEIMDEEHWDEFWSDGEYVYCEYTGTPAVGDYQRAPLSSNGEVGPWETVTG